MFLSFVLTYQWIPVYSEGGEAELTVATASSPHRRTGISSLFYSIDKNKIL